LAQHQTKDEQRQCECNTTISGPFVSDNLAMYLIQGADCADLGSFETLEEALENNKVELKETGNVNQLHIKNRSDKVLFIQSGEIVKGGKQDRTLQHDMILQGHSDFVPINSFCVEQGRWSKRGNEDVGHFHSSNHYAHTSVRLAAKLGKQHEVWKEVGKLQYQSALNAHVPLTAVQGESVSSLQLTLDTETVRKCTARYLENLSQVINEKNDVLGCAFAINGAITSVDVYSCNKLLKKMAPKLLSAAAVEAFAELKERQEFVPPTASDVMACLQEPGQSPCNMVTVSGKAKIVSRESSKNILFETQDLMNGGQWVHRSYCSKGLSR